MNGLAEFIILWTGVILFFVVLVSILNREHPIKRRTPAPLIMRRLEQKHKHCLPPLTKLKRGDGITVITYLEQRGAEWMPVMYTVVDGQVIREHPLLVISEERAANMRREQGLS